VRQALADVDGVASVEVSYDDRRADVWGDASMDAAELIRAVTVAGFEASVVAE
jgi:copper chaperone CopZ